jgi:hypothetical protein
MLSFLDREKSIAEPGYNRWIFPPAALAVHLCIGQVYGISVFNIPMTKLIGITESQKGVDWTIPEIGWIFSIALAVLGLSAAVFGPPPFSENGQSVPVRARRCSFLLCVGQRAF